MNRSNAHGGWAILALAAGALAAAGPAAADWALDFPASATGLGGDIRSLHHLALIICVVIGVLVFGLLGYSLVKFRDHGISFFSNMAEKSKAAAIVGAGGELHEHYLRDVDNPMVVPAGRKVKLQLTSNDVIHAWWVPELYVKRDAVPGTINETWFQVDEPGVYRGQCAELCGRGHGFMPIVVEALEPNEFEAWAARSAEPDEPRAIMSNASADATGGGAAR